MFEFYNKDAITEVGGSKQIIGRRDTNLCLLRNGDVPIYAGNFSDCEYVAAALNAARDGATIPLYFNRLFFPCCKEEAVRSIEKEGCSYTMTVKYSKTVSCGSTMESALKEIFDNYSPYSVLMFDINGKRVLENYRKLVLIDRRTDAAMCVAFINGIEVLCVGNTGVAVSAAAGLQYDGDTGLTYSDMATDVAWSWNCMGNVSSKAACEKDPDVAIKKHI